eukprot:gene13289-28135_t
MFIINDWGKTVYITLLLIVYTSSFGFTTINRSPSRNSLFLSTDDKSEAPRKLFSRKVKQPVVNKIEDVPIIKYRTKDLIRSSEGIPIVPVQASRPIPSSLRSGGSGGKRILPQGEARASELINPSRLHIIAGTAKGKKLDSPQVYLRPMMSKVREALFSTLTFMGMFDSNTTRILDVFSGSGSVGLEALSRGAGQAVFVDMSSDCTQTALRNADRCGFSGRAGAVCAKADEVLLNPTKFGLSEPFSLVSITPPYEEIAYSELIDWVCQSPLVVEDTVVIIEYPVEMKTLPYILGEDKLFGLRNRRYGRTVLGIYVCRPSKKYDMRPDEFLKI